MRERECVRLVHMHLYDINTCSHKERTCPPEFEQEDGKLMHVDRAVPVVVHLEQLLTQVCLGFDSVADHARPGRKHAATPAHTNQVAIRWHSCR